MPLTGPKAMFDRAYAEGYAVGAFNVNNMEIIQGIVAAAAARCGQHYVNSNWLGGTLTNWKTVSQSVKRLKETEERIEKGDFEGLTKKERLTLDRKKDKLSKSLGGIKNMNGRPDLMFVIDIVKERLAIDEANCLGIPVVAICDSNADPMLVNFPVPANDDASKAIALYCDLAVGAVLDGMAAELKAAGVDVDAKPDEDVVDKGE